MAREKGMGSLQLEKSGRWTARICVDGLKICRSTRTKDRTQAEAFLMRMLAPFGRGEKRLALADVWRMYEKSPKRRDLAPATIIAKRGVWMHFASWMETNHPEVVQLKQLSLEIVGEYLRVLRIDHTASTYNNRVCVLREVCRVLADDAGVIDDPWAGVRLLTDDSHTRREFTREELVRIVASASQEKSGGAGTEWRLLFLLGIYTGQRLGDCCTLRWCDVKADRGVIQLIPRKTRKHMKGVPVTIPIHPELNDSLAPERAAARSVAESGDSTLSGEYVLPEMARWYLNGEHWRISRGLEEIFKRAKIVTSIRIEGRKTATPDATFHSLRHSFVSFAVNGGVPLPVVQSIVGHSSNAMTRHYYHENVDALRSAVAAIPSLGALPAEAKGEARSLGRQAPPHAEQEDALTPAMVEEMRRMYEVLKRTFERERPPPRATGVDVL